jgi:hypothetical protein
MCECCDYRLCRLPLAALPVSRHLYDAPNQRAILSTRYFFRFSAKLPHPTITS